MIFAIVDILEFVMYGALVVGCVGILAVGLFIAATVKKRRSRNKRNTP